MALIYQGSYINIAAAKSTSSDIQFTNIVQSAHRFMGLDNRGVENNVSPSPRLGSHYEMFAYQLLFLRSGFNEPCPLP